MKNILIILLTIGTSLSGFGQSQQLILSVGMNSFDQTNGLKTYDNFLASHLKTNGIDARSFDNYPPYLNLGIEYRFNKINQTSIGLLYRFTSTGSSINYSDFSGQLHIRNLLTSHYLGLSSISSILNSSVFIPKFQANYGIIYSFYTSKYLVDIYTENKTESAETESKSNSFTPFIDIGFNWLFEIYQVVGLSAFMGYSVSIPTTIEPSYEKALSISDKILPRNTTKIRIGNNGFTSSIGIWYFF